jgi:hypothetical protein
LSDRLLHAGPIRLGPCITMNADTPIVVDLEHLLGDAFADTVPGALTEIHLNTHELPHTQRTNAGSRLIPCTKLLSR